MKKQTVITIGMVLALTGILYAEDLTVNSDHVIIDRPYGQINMYNSSTAEILSGAQIDKLTTRDTSYAQMYGGHIETSDAYSLIVQNGSTFDLLGGTVATGDNRAVYTNHTAVFNLSGGAVGQIEAISTSIVNMSGGSATQLRTSNSSIANVSGSAVISNRLTCRNTSTMYISGGTIADARVLDDGIIEITGGDISKLYAGFQTYAGGTIILTGSDFMLGDGLTWDVDGKTILGTGTVSGTWLNGTDFTTTIMDNVDGTIMAVVPEPATLVLLGLGGLSLLKRNRRA